VVIVLATGEGKKRVKKDEKSRSLFFRNSQFRQGGKSANKAVSEEFELQLSLKGGSK